MREMIVPRMIRLEEKTKLPRTRDPEFATPKARKKTDTQTDKDGEGK